MKPMLTGTDFQQELGKGGADGQDLARRSKEDAIYTSTVFKQAGCFPQRGAGRARGSAGCPAVG